MLRGEIQFVCEIKLLAEPLSQLQKQHYQDVYVLNSGSYKNVANLFLQVLFTRDIVYPFFYVLVLMYKVLCTVYIFI